MKLSNLIGIRSIFIAHANESVNTKLAYKMMKFIKASDDEETFYNNKIKEIVELYGEKGKDGEFIKDKIGNIRIKTTNLDECRLAIKQLDDTDVECPSISFTIDELGELKLSMSDMYAIDEIIIEEG